ncbi:MAG: hypothetical protein RLZZ220_1821 [Pseudomonadota bacterium]
MRAMTSLRRRLSVTLALVLLAAGALLAVSLQDFPRRLVEDYVLSRLHHDADLLYVRLLDAVAAAPGPRIDPATMGSVGPVYELPLSGHYFLIKRGEQLIRSRSLWDEDIAMPELGGAVERVQRGDGPAGQALLVFAARFPDAGGGLPVTLVVAEDVTTIDAAIADFRLKTFIALALALGLLLILQRRVLVQGLAPLDEAVAACLRLERGEVVPIDATAPAEVQPMLDAVSRLAHHHTQRLTRIRHAVGNLSHALKTPLAVLAQDADEIGRRGDPALAARLHAQLDTMRETMARELHRARLSGGGPVGSSFEVRGQLAVLVDVLQRLHAERHISIELDAPDEALPVDREDMLELFGNLLDNACKWARGRVRVQVEPAGAGGQLAFSVEDDGPGVPEALLGQLGTAGLRTDESRPGHGLGLAIVSDIVAQYGGTLRFGRSAGLGGLRVEVSLPVAG